MRLRNQKLFPRIVAILGGVLLLSSIFYLLSSVPTVHALEVGVSEVDDAIALSNTDIRVVIARIIRVALGLLGIIAVSLVIYGGFLWMTAAGDEDKVAQAKRVLSNAVIGLVIILTSFAITQFVLSRLVEATTGIGSGTNQTDGGGTLPGLQSASFRVTSFRPSDPAVPPAGFIGFCRNTTIRLQMSERVDAATVPANLVLHHFVGPGNAPIDPTEAVVSGKQVTVRSAIPCAERPSERCFEPGITYKFNFEASLRSAESPFRTVNCATSGGLCDARFTIADCLDTASPEVTIMVPSPGQSVPPDWVTIRSRASDDQAIGSVEFFDGNSSLGFGDITPAGVLTPVDATYEWSTMALLDAPGEEPGDRSCRVLAATAFDVNDHRTDSSRVPVVVRPAHCFNGLQDSNETGLDCGGDPAVAGYCGKCAGEFCNPGDFCSNACRSGSCVSSTCVDLPRIDDFTRNAGPGSFITIAGEFFGTNGAVTFLGAAGTRDDVLARPASCEGAWTPTQIIVEVPADVTIGPLAVTTTVGTDSTDNDRGVVDNFSSASPTLPGLCPVVPDEGEVETSITLRGNGFGGVQLDSTVTVGSAEARVVNSWGAQEIRTKIPATPSGPYAISVTVSGQTSNAVMFTVLGPEAGTTPVVTAVIPSTGPIGTYLTISGTNFGTVGQVLFRNPGTGATAIGDVDFPEQCDGVSWAQNEVTVKVPATYSSGVASDGGTALERVAHELVVRRSGVNEATSNSATFTVTDGAPAPGLCGLLPVSGPENTLVRFFGEGFGTAANTAAQFFDERITAPTFVEREELRARVPANAQTGPVVVTVERADDPSNPRNFAVADCREDGAACGTGLECCANGTCVVRGSCGEELQTGGYAWYISTGPVPRVPRLIFACGENIIPSPAPYVARAGGEDVCVNALATGRFSIPMDVTTINGSNVQLSRCTGDGEDRDCTGEVKATVETFEWSISGGTQSGHGFRVIPEEELAPNTWYEVEVFAAIRGSDASGGVALEPDEDCSSGVAYCWQFKTRETGELCVLDDVSIEPFDHVTTAAGALGRVMYTAFGRTDDDICIALDTRPYDFAWTANAPDGYATISEGVPGDLPGFVATTEDDRAVATPVLETPANNPVDVRAIASDGGNTLAAGAAFLTIDYTDPEVVEYAPNCSEACINAKLRLRFNTDMSGAPLAYSVLNPATLRLWQCPNETCVFPTTTVDLEVPTLNPVEDDGIPAGHILSVSWADNLLPNTFYRAILNGGVQSRSGVSLVGENYGTNFSWVFRTKNDATPCEVSSVELIPGDVTVDTVGTRVPFTAIPRSLPDECSSTGQELDAREEDWDWSIEDDDVAEYLVAGEPRDTSAALALACSSQCLNTGAAGVFGRVAVCGNGEACTLLAHCDAGEVCSRGQCVETLLGEECDDGNIDDGDGCSKICLHEGSLSNASISGENSLAQSADFPVISDYPSGAGDLDPQNIASSTDAVSGVASARIHSGTVLNPAGNYGGAIVSTPVAVQTVGTTYTLSYLAKKMVPDVTTLRLSHQNGDGVNSTLSHSITLTTAWTRYAYTATLDAAKTGLTIWSDEADRIWLLDNIRLVAVPGTTPPGLQTFAPTTSSVCQDGNLNQNEDCDGGVGCSSICLHEGAQPSSFGGTTCNNGVIDLGEDCDDGNRATGDGCSSQCLREGSRPGPLAICGNGDVEIGEECDGGAGCDLVTCLHIGTNVCTPPFPSTATTVCCGNAGASQAGEDCDDGNIENGDGCSSRCLYEGSSVFYATPSFCGDGTPFGTGEECESRGGDGRIDPFQVAEAVGRAVVSDGEQSTTLAAGIGVIADEASFTLQCGFTSDDQCRDPVSGVSVPGVYGVGSNSCCYARPQAARTIPPHERTDVCRNPLIRIEFNQPMDLGSFAGHALLARGTDVGSCAAGEEEMTRLLPPPLAGVPLAVASRPFGLLWERMWSWIYPFGSAVAAPLPPAIPWDQPAGAGAWCLGRATGRISGVHHENDPNTPTDDRSSLIFTLENGALDQDTWYRVRVIGEAAVGDDLVHGVRSSNGVGMAANYEFSFRTGTAICTADQVVVSDESNAELFTRSGEEHLFAATAYSYRAGTLDPIVPVSDVYDWAWGTWASANSVVVTVPDQSASSVNPNTATVTAGGRNGTTTVSTSLAISTDTLSPQTTVGRIASGNARVEVFICENLGLEVRDVRDNDLDLPAPFGNFATRYCRDAGAPGASDDFPMMRAQTVSQPPGMAFKEFLLQYENPADDGNDAIGFRVLSNPNHFSAARWYTTQGFAGTPQALLVDGYDVVRDDRTVYIHAANLDPDIGQLYDNIYVLSVNENATPETVNIFEQLLANLVFNQNLITANTNLCTPVPAGTIPVSCSSDFDCSVGRTCQAPKDKIRRDTRRLADVRDMEAALGRACSGGSCTYPALGAGTFVRAVSVSTWPSWTETLSANAGSFLPTDPLNRFSACPAGYDPNTCFAAQAVAGCTDGNCYQCPLGSQVYEYTSRAPDEYRLALDLEYDDNPWAVPIAPFSASTGATFVVGQATPYCQGTVVGESNVCGDGVLGSAEFCERGQTGVRACTGGQIAAICNNTCSAFLDQPGATCIDERCGDGVIQSGEICDDGANNGFYGFCNTSCSERSAFCGDSTLAGIEQCDLGAANGQWNRTPGTPALPLSCAWDCSFPGPFCGDNEVNGGSETCDGGFERGSGVCTNNNALPCTLNADCGSAPGVSCTLHCGERLYCTGGGTVAERESACAGRVGGDTCTSAAAGVCRRWFSDSRLLATGVVRCTSRVSNTTACRDKHEGETCATSAGPGVCTGYQIERARPCTGGVGVSACSWGSLGSCQVVGSCGDTEVQGSEQCDDGNENENDACTTSCRFNVCGDGFRYDGVELCDAGGVNGVPCVAPYGGTCNYCSPTCTFVTQTGGFCGDGTITGGERCDYSANPIVPTPAPADYTPGVSLCQSSSLAGVEACMAYCPPTYAPAAVRFREPTPSNTYTFTESGDTNQLSIPACRLGGGLVLATVNFGADVIHFPSPMDVLLVLDNSLSMDATEQRNIRKALCGAARNNCEALDDDGAIKRLFNSRDMGDVRIGIIEFGGKSRYASWNGGTSAPALTYDESTCSATDPVPCYDRDQYFGPDNRRRTADDGPATLMGKVLGATQTADDTGMLEKSSAHEEALRSIIMGLSGGNISTRSYLALRQAHAILDTSNARSKVIIYLSDGNFAGDCCSYFTASNTSGTCNNLRERSHCAVPTNPCVPKEVGAPSGVAAYCNGFTSQTACNNNSSGIGVETLCRWSPACAVASGSFECGSSDPEADEMNELGDGITVFTVSVTSPATVSALMERWSDRDPSGVVDFSYAGTNVTQMFDGIISNIGVRLQVANNASFSDAGAVNWMDEVTIAEPDFSVPFPTPELNNACTDDWQSVYVRALYGGAGDDATVTLTDPRWNYCPRVSF